jgi:hypothetical protein
MGTVRVTIEPMNDGDVIKITGTVPPPETEKDPKVYTMTTSTQAVTPPLIIELEGNEKLNIECEMLSKHEYDKDQFAAVKIPPDTTLADFKATEGKKNAEAEKKREDEEEKRTGAKKKAKERDDEMNKVSKDRKPEGAIADSGAKTPFPGTGAQVGGARDSHDVKAEAHPRPTRPVR